MKTALRAVFGKPAFSALVVAVLAGGLGCMLFILAVINGMVWKPLPFPNAERIAAVGLVDPSNPDDDINGVIDLDYLELQRRLADQGTLAGYSTGTVNLSDDGRPERYSGGFVTANVFDHLGVQPYMGSGFQAGDDRPGAARKAVISHLLWQQRYAGDPQIIGRMIRANSENYEVAGVMPEGFAFPSREDVWLPLPIDPAREPGAARYLSPMLLVDGEIDYSAIQTKLDAWQTQRLSELGPQAADQVPKAEYLGYQFMDRTTRKLLNLMLVAVGLVLLIACANGANLMLSRTLARSGELAVRSALGASKLRMAIQVFMQCLLLSLAATAAGLALGRLGVEWLNRVFLGSENAAPRWMTMEFDGRMMLIALAVAVFTALVTAIVPALRAAGVGVAQVLRDGGRGSSGGWFSRISRGLVVMEVGLSCALLIMAAMMVKVVHGLSQQDLGVQGRGLLTARLGLFENTYPTGEDRYALFQRISQAVKDTPGVVDVGISTTLPGKMGGYAATQVEGQSAADGRRPYTRWGAIDEGFASTWKLPLQQGRLFDSRDRADTEAVAIIDATYAKRIFGDADPLGRRIELELERGVTSAYTVVGITAPVHLEDPGDDIMPAVFLPLVQNPDRFVSVAVRTVGEPMAFAQTLTQVMAKVDPDTPLYWLEDFETVLHQSTLGERILAKLFSTFGLVALLLAAGGLYGVVSFAVSQRTRELGVRRALGAPDQRILRSVVGRSGLEVGFGMVIGLGLGLFMANLLSGLLQDDSGIDGLSTLAVVLSLTVVAGLAALIPARRALKVDPMVALRWD
ncbi:MAG: ABC transporter permease [Xanthomonadales bacterium]|nr:ABC transporter permease [Xanthomonadales bacterium]